jgi:hypothetical protein
VSLRAVVTALTLVGCDQTTRIEGIVEVVGMPTQAGIAVRSEDGQCSALTDESGSFAMDCRRGLILVNVALDSTPHYPSAHSVEVLRTESLSIGLWTLTPQPPTDGLWWVGAQGLLPLARTHLVRTGDRGAKSYCLDAGSQTSGQTAAPGNVYFVDQQAPDWKLFRLDDDGCAQRWRWHAGDWRITSSDEPEASVEHLAKAKLHHFALPAGRYFVADWADGRLTPDRAQTTTAGEKRYLGAVFVVAE